MILQSNVQLIPTSTYTQGKQKDIFSDYYEATKEEDTKNTLKLSFNLFKILIK